MSVREVDERLVIASPVTIRIHAGDGGHGFAGIMNQVTSIAASMHAAAVVALHASL